MNVDVAVVGDGPAGSALASELGARGVDVVLIGDDRPWLATYGVWPDELAGARVDVTADAARVVDEVVVGGARRRTVTRRYAMLDNDTLRARLRRDVPVRRGRIARIEDLGLAAAPRWRLSDEGGTVGARLVVDATGSGSAFVVDRPVRPRPAYQTAFGVVLPEPPTGDLGRATLMDFGRTTGAVASGRHVPTFLYAMPVADGWLVEETVLAARPAIEPLSLAPRLAARLGMHVDAMLAAAVRTEYVRIPMGGALPRRRQRIVAFGAAAGMVHPATGYSLGASLRAVDRVAAAIVAGLDAASAGRAPDSTIDGVWEAVWPTPLRRTRQLHDVGLEVLLGLDVARTQRFFDTFFDLPLDRWSAFMTIDARPADVSRVMLALFARVPWDVRRRLVRSAPGLVAGLVRGPAR